ncbi:MAG: undecaprenyl/decaprenyl-phosphate alpha-N-acetylglucosaminyl 1-phosphate transferase [Deltaproteobacteria bacterium]|nr:MAG: undecaprenyl/decaprenyl-phosphate alpha-N-acetylglucosaminyl 1-phosphate transferase [Deltaproteobacteria bacterium]
MPDEARLFGALLLSLAAASVLTPAAIRVAARSAFFDHPVGYKAHPVPTAYLGGAALVAATVLSGSVFARRLDGFWVLAGSAAALWAVGTLDDRISVSPLPRLIAEAAAGATLWAVNAFNLMDNMDGAAATVGAVCSSCAGFVATLGGDIALGTLAFALAGACLGFLPYNLRAGASARIFLGDGGSMPLGLLVAAILMSGPLAGKLGWPGLLAAGLVVGLPIFDTVIVVASRARRGVPVYRGARDHLTHRLSANLRSPREVAIALALAQIGLGAGAIAASEIGAPVVDAFAAICIVIGAAGVIVLDTPAWRYEASGLGRPRAASETLEEAQARRIRAAVEQASSSHAEF